ncbi:MAG TPA: serine hydrolase [Longimicrobiales bacterium]|nr:serine hydrolase [Longimicrobiales bacterium]
MTQDIHSINKHRGTGTTGWLKRLDSLPEADLMRSGLLFAAFIAAAATPAFAQTSYTIALKAPAVERIVMPGKAHTYSLNLPARYFVSAAADQRSADVVVKVFDPTGRQLGSWDGPARGDETFKFNTRVAGEYKIEVSAFERDSGAYALRLIRSEPFATSPEARVAQIMSDYDSTTPGGVVAVVRSGKIVFARGYGMANLEHGVRNTPQTVYHMASVSKQFTAFATLLLADEGKLSLDDDIHKYIPELADFGTPITVRHLINHTSGIRDQWVLWGMAGGRLDDVITHADLMNLLRRQKELNFAPGAEYLYSNSGYTLLSEIVARVAKEPFGVFMKTRVFDPLGMKNTQIYDDHERLVKGRADSYRRNEQQQWSKAVLSYANRGATSLFTTASDLALWLDNYRTAKIGGARVMQQMQQRGVLNKGDTLNYASGLVIWKDRGLNAISHGGADAGFRTSVSYYPEVETGIILLGNEGGFNTAQVSDDVAEAFFGDRMTTTPVAPPTQQPPAPQQTPWTPTTTELQSYVGAYYSAELETRYEVVIDKDALVARHRRNGDIALRPVRVDNFRAAPFYFSDIRFERDAQGKVTGMLVSAGRVRNLRFELISDAHAGPFKRLER